jgi:hypothetical protein
MQLQRKIQARSGTKEPKAEAPEKQVDAAEIGLSDNTHQTQTPAS